MKNPGIKNRILKFWSLTIIINIELFLNIEHIAIILNSVQNFKLHHLYDKH